MKNKIKLTEEQRNLVENNIGLVHYVLRNFNPENKNSDCVSVGYLYLCKAAYKYNPELGKFATFAFSYIKFGVRSYFRQFEKQILRKRNGVYKDKSTESLDNGMYDFIDNNEIVKLPSDSLNQLLKIIPNRFHPILKGLYEDKSIYELKKSKVTSQRMVTDLRKYVKSSVQYSEHIKKILKEAGNEFWKNRWINWARI